MRFGAEKEKVTKKSFCMFLHGWQVARLALPWQGPAYMQGLAGLSKPVDQPTTHCASRLPRISTKHVIGWKHCGAETLCGSLC